MSKDNASGDTSDISQESRPALVAQWEAAQVQESVARLLSRGFPEPFGPVSSFRSILDGQSQECPGRYGYNIEAYFGCVSQQGWYWSGISVLSEMGDGQFIFVGDFFAEDPSGQLWTGAGDIGMIDRGWSGLSYFVRGTWGYAGLSGWMQTTSSSYLEYTYSGGMLMVQGSYGAAGDFLDFQALRVEDGVVQGGVGVRDPSEGWWSWEAGEDGCGSLLFEGQPQAEGVCLIEAGWLEGLAQSLGVL